MGTEGAEKDGYLQGFPSVAQNRRRPTIQFFGEILNAKAQGRKGVNSWRLSVFALNLRQVCVIYGFSDFSPNPGTRITMTFGCMKEARLSFFFYRCKMTRIYFPRVTAQPVISTSASEEKSCVPLRKISRGASRHSK